jgi:N-acetylglucosaminyl-diphospho-decaprenol L-rhamnosyltransferase
MPHDSPPDVSVIIVSWNVRDLLEDCLESLLASPGIEWGDQAPDRIATEDTSLLREPPLSGEVIVVDNASNDGSPEMVRSRFPWVRLIAYSENLGFARGNNRAISLSRGRYVLFLNPDTVVLGDAVAAMVVCMGAHREIGVLGPELRYGDGSLQSSRRRFPTFLMALFESTPLAWHWPGNRWARRYHMDDIPPAAPGGDEIQLVDWVVGAVLLTRKEILDQVGGFDEGYFMYSEELDWCRRAVDCGWRVAFFPEAQVVHYEGKSSEQFVVARHIRFQTSKVRYFRKFHGALAAGALRASVLVMFSIEWALEAVKWLAGSRRALRRERMAAYAKLLGTGLREG